MTSFDWGVIAVLVLSTGFAVIRGALREIGTVIALLAGLARREVWPPGRLIAKLREVLQSRIFDCGLAE